MRDDDVQFVTVEFYPDKQRILKDGPEILATEILANKSDLVQSMSFMVDKSTQKTSSFTHEVGTSLEVGTEFEGGVPFLVKDKWSINLTVSYKYTWGKTESEMKGWHADFPVQVSGNSIVEAVASVFQSQADIPYTMTIVYKDGHRDTSKGTYKGVDQVELRYEVGKALFYQVKDSEGRIHKTGLNMEFLCPKDNKNVIVQKDFTRNYGVGDFDAGRTISDNECPDCHGKLTAKDFRQFWFNQCTMKYDGYLVESDKPKSGGANFTETPGRCADLDADWLTLSLTLAYPDSGGVVSMSEDALKPEDDAVPMAIGYPAPDLRKGFEQHEGLHGGGWYWRCFSQGLNIEYSCGNCNSEKEVIAAQLGMGTFDAARSVAGKSCPKCDHSLLIRDVIGYWLYQTKFSWDGRLQEDDTEVKGSKTFSDDHLYRTLGEAVNYSYLTLTAEDL